MSCSFSLQSYPLASHLSPVKAKTLWWPQVLTCSSLIFTSNPLINNSNFICSISFPRSRWFNHTGLLAVPVSILLDLQFPLTWMLVSQITVRLDPSLSSHLYSTKISVKPFLGLFKKNQCPFPIFPIPVIILLFSLALTTIWYTLYFTFIFAIWFPF